MHVGLVPICIDPIPTTHHHHHQRVCPFIYLEMVKPTPITIIRACASLQPNPNPHTWRQLVNAMMTEVTMKMLRQLTRIRQKRYSATPGLVCWCVVGGGWWWLEAT